MTGVTSLFTSKWYSPGNLPSPLNTFAYWCFVLASSKQGVSVACFASTLFALVDGVNSSKLTFQDLVMRL